MLTDTTFWIDLLDERRERRRGPAHRFIAAHRANALRVSIVTWGELAESVQHSADLDALLHGVRLLTLPRQIAWEASRIQRELAEEGAMEYDYLFPFALGGPTIARNRVPLCREHNAIKGSDVHLFPWEQGEPPWS